MLSVLNQLLLTPLALITTALAEMRGVSGATLSVAWVLNKARRLGVTCVPIPGTTKEGHAKANLAAKSVELSDEEMAALAKAAADKAAAAAAADAPA